MARSRSDGAVEIGEKRLGYRSVCAWGKDVEFEIVKCLSVGGEVWIEVVSNIDNIYVARERVASFARRLRQGSDK